MAKKRRKIGRQQVSSEDKLFDFVLGILYFFVLEAIFMLGGLYLENNVLGVGAATGIPSLMGLIVWIGLSGFYEKKKSMFLGGLAISVIVPIILIVVAITRFVDFLPVMYYSIGAFVILEILAALYLTKK